MPASWRAHSRPGTDTRALTEIATQVTLYKRNRNEMRIDHSYIWLLLLSVSGSLLLHHTYTDYTETGAVSPLKRFSEFLFKQLVFDFTQRLLSSTWKSTHSNSEVTNQKRLLVMMVFDRY